MAGSTHSSHHLLPIAFSHGSGPGGISDLEQREQLLVSSGGGGSW